MVPAIDDRLLPDNAASQSTNAWLFSGRIEPVHSLVPIHTMVNPAARSVFRRPKANPGIDYMTDSDWLEFENQNVRVIRSPIAGQDDDGRFYWADGVYPKMMTGTMIENGDPPYQLGIPPPNVAPTVVPSGGTSSTLTTVSYVYTWVSANGEEGPPSAPTTVEGKIDDTYQLTLFAPSSAQTANRDLTKTRIYRTVVSQQGVATYFFVAEIPITQLTYDDDMATDTDEVVTNNETMTSTYYFPPPADLQQLVPMANGMVAGFRNNEVWFCEPYYPHAWPVQYVIGVDAVIVGLGVIDQSVIILTQGQPYAATGVDPSAMALTKIQPLEACTSMLSIVNTPGGVLYCSPNGLINITPMGAQNLTAKMITKDEWYRTLHLDSVAAGVLASGYYAFSIETAGVFQNSSTPPDTFNAFQQDAFQQSSAFGTEPGVYISLNDQRIAVTELDPAPNDVWNVITDVYNGELMTIRDGVVYLVDIRQLAPYAEYLWRSKIFSMPYPLNFGAAKVYWIVNPAHVEPPHSTFRVYAGDQADDIANSLPLRFEELLKPSGQVHRLPSGFKAMYWQFEVEGHAVISAIHVAETPRLLRMI
jgi:hypothetical protein